MAEFFELKVNKSQLDETFRLLPEATKKAIANSLNKTGRKANSEIKKFITKNYNIKASSLKIGDTVRLSNADARRDKGTFSIFIKKLGRGLFKYDAKQVRTGVQAKVKKTPKIYRGAFISVWQKGSPNKFVFRRDKKLGYYYKGKTKKEKRKSLFGPMIADLYKSRGAERVLKKVVENEFEKNLNDAFNQQFERKK